MIKKYILTAILFFSGNLLYAEGQSDSLDIEAEKQEAAAGYYFAGLQFGLPNMLSANLGVSFYRFNLQSEFGLSRWLLFNDLYSLTYDLYKDKDRQFSLGPAYGDWCIATLSNTYETKVAGILASYRLEYLYLQAGSFYHLNGADKVLNKITVGFIIHTGD